MKKFALVIFAVAISLPGCTSVHVRPVANVAAIKHVCVRQCPDDCFVADMPDVIAEGFERNGISAEIFTGNLPSSCEYHVQYMCNQTWDMAMYMHHAEIRLYQGTKQIGYAEYHLDGQGGLSLMKWQGTRAKIDPVMDELLGK